MIVKQAAKWVAEAQPVEMSEAGANESEVFSRATEASMTGRVRPPSVLSPSRSPQGESSKKVLRGHGRRSPGKISHAADSTVPGGSWGHVQSNRLELPGVPAPATGRGIASAYESKQAVQFARAIPDGDARAAGVKPPLRSGSTPAALAWNQRTRIPEQIAIDWNETGDSLTKNQRCPCFVSMRHL